MCKDIDESREAVGTDLITEYGPHLKEIVDTLITEPDKDQFFMEWDLIAYDKLKLVTDKLILEGSITITE